MSEVQAVLDAAAEVIAGYSEHESEFSVAFVKLGTMQGLENAVDAWRKAGGMTSDEMEDDLELKLAEWRKSRADEARSYEVSSRPCQTCCHPEWLHTAVGTACSGQNVADTGGCDCKAFASRGATP